MWMLSQGIGLMIEAGIFILIMIVITAVGGWANKGPFDD